MLRLFMGVVLMLSMAPVSHAITIEQSSSLETPAIDSLSITNPAIIRDSQLQEIVQLIQAGKQQEANVQIARILAQRPKDKDALELAGISLMMMKNFKAAEEAFRRLMALPPVKADVITKYGVTKILNGDVKIGRTLLQQVVRATPDDNLANRYLGWLAQQSGDTREAIFYLEKLPSAQIAGLKDYHIDLARNYKQVQAYRAIIDLLSPVLSPDKLANKRYPTQAALYLTLSYAALGETKKSAQWDASLRPLVAGNPLNLFQLEMGLAEVTKDTQAAQAAARGLMERVPDAEAHARFGLARVFLLAGQVIKAMDEYELALKIVDEADTARILQVMIPVLLNERMNDYAIDVLERATRKYPDNDDFLYGLADLQASSGRIQASQKTLAALIDRPQPHVPALLLGGEAARAEKNYALATRYLRQYIDINPSGEKGWIALAGVQFDQGKLSQAIEILKQGAAVNPTKAVLAYELGTLYQAAGQLDMANRQYEAALALNANYLAAMDNLASNLLDMNQNIQKARDLAEKVYAELPDAPYIQDLWGWALYRSGDLKSAQTALSKAADGITDSGRADYHLALTLRDLGDHEKAKKHFRLALDKGLSATLQSEVEAAIKATN
ncbi:tetratricopeptide repeat protein [Sedimenticola hydrogenitrophicus]|uniref:tetratricopeptide repeat protein n=1 Tax=Sedimenticola hydrogenitrophicus TaxID=2967975 RepID=UPI0021A32A5F|nr:tetratricopeptide repeat protein [Sedimenticola hydrogenitrophicus]